MGYSVFCIKTDVFIPKKFHDELFASIKSLIGNEREKNKANKFAFIEPQQVSMANNISEVLEFCRWLPAFDDEGNINGLEFLGEKLGDDVLLFQNISRYISDNGNVVMVGEDGKVWRWIFFQGNMKEQIGKIIFPD